MIRLEQVTRVYPRGGADVRAIDGITLTIPTGEFVALMGPSGCGKTTLINLIGAIDRPTSGGVWLDEERLDLLSDDRLTRLRRTNIGIVYQFFNLLPTLSASENIGLPLLLYGLPAREIAARVARQLEQVGLAHRAHHWPHELSGGEQQRVAVARALMQRPDLVLADEPTGNLDTHTGEALFELMRGLNRGRGTTFVIVTHNEKLSAQAGRIIHMEDGLIINRQAGPKISP